MIPVRDPGGLPLTLRGLPPVDEVVVVSETPGPASPVDLAEIVRAARPDARVLRAGRPGPGNALATGLAAASGDVVVMLNGDGSTDPAEIPHYVAALTAGADVAVGSRYRDGGRDLTGGRFRRWANVLLIGVVNALFGVRRTDPGFGFAAFWRDALTRLDLPDPSARAGAAWGDGPELGPLLSLRPSIRGLQVAEVASVAYPRMSRPARAERPGPRHWLRLLATEFPHRHGRHAAGSESTAGAPSGFASRAGSTRADGSAARTGLPGTRPGGNGPAGAGAAGTTADLGVAGADGGSAHAGGAEWLGADHRSQELPIWAPSRRRPSPSRDLWRAGENPVPHTSPRSIANVTPHAWLTGYPGRAAGPDAKPRSAQDSRPESAQARSVPPQPPAAPRREVGTKRRRIEGLRQRPDLRVINGEGEGSGRTRSGRLRPVPKENLGG